METILKDSFTEIVKHIKGIDLVRLCVTNKNLRQLCDQNFWKFKLQEDYPDSRYLNMPGDYKQIYLHFINVEPKRIPIYYNGEYHMNLWIDKFDTYQTILNKLKKSPLTRDILQYKFVQAYYTHNDSDTSDVTLTFMHDDIVLFKQTVYWIERTYLIPTPNQVTSVWIDDREFFSIKSPHDIVI